jgi:hypothetical protein
LFQAVIEEANETTEENNKIFQCADCQRSFAKKSSLVRHWRIVHKIGEDMVRNLSSEIQLVSSQKSIDWYLQTVVETKHNIYCKP